ncbi:MAG: acyl-CoA dehydrogenase family protein, partial [Chloroflexi bacterium]|nr:acyl-CoA dehydrogenase family protein [Chloroflexota bacterium]
MTFEFTAEQREFRAEVCAFLTEELTPEVWTRHRDENEYGGWSVDYMRAFRRKLGERGYIGMGWPAEYGGGGKDMIYQVILTEELEYHAAPGLDRTITYLPMGIIAFGTEAQKKRFLPRLRHGELALYVGYSEPEAGS